MGKFTLLPTGFLFVEEPVHFATMPRQDGRFFITFTTPSGRRVRRSTSTRDRTIAAEKAKQIYLEECKRDLAPAPVTTRFADAAAAYMKAGGERRFMEKLLLHFGPDTFVDDIDEIAITAACQAIYPNGSSQTWRRQAITPTRAVQNFAAGVRRRPSADQPRTRWLTPEEAKSLLDAADTPTRSKIAFLLVLDAGPEKCLRSKERIIPKEVIIDPFDGDKSVHSGRRSA